MSKWRKVGSANACAPSMVRATQRIRTASCRRIEIPPYTLRAVSQRPTRQGLRYERRLAEKKPLLVVGLPHTSFRASRGPKAGVRGIRSPFIKIYERGWDTPHPSLLRLLPRASYAEDWLPCRSAPGVAEYHSVARVADGYGQRGLQRIKELLHIAGAEAAAHPQSGNIRIADDDACIGVAFDLGDGVRQPFAVENDRAFTPCEFGGQLLRGDGDDGVVATGGGQAFPRIERADGGRGGGARVRILRCRQRRLYLDAAFGHDHIDVLIGHYADLERSNHGPHHRVSGVHQERPRAVVGDLEVRFALA